VIKCVDYDPDTPGWSCGQPCLTSLRCNAAEVAMSDGTVKPHICESLCHQGACPPCQIEGILACFCGKHSKEIHCCYKEFPKKSTVEDGLSSKSWLGFYQCEAVCGR
jgi:transcriptional repressor NF-X1